MADKDDEKVGAEEVEVVAVDADGKPIDPLPGTEPAKKEAKAEPKAEVKAEPKVEAKAEPEDDEDDDDEPDERVGQSDTGETEEQKRERRREERHERRRKQRAMAERDRREREFLIARNQELEQQVGGIARRVAVTEQAAIQQRMAQLDQQLQLAEDVMAKAIEAGDGKTHAEALRIRDQVLQGRQRLEAALQRQQAEAAERPPQGQQQANQPPAQNQEVLRRAQRFLQANPWYDPRGGDEDSAIAQVVDQRIKAEGFDPSTDEYWAELTSRLRRRLPQRFAQGKAEGVAGDDDDDSEDEQPSSSRAPSKKDGAGAKRHDAPNFPSGRPSRTLKAGEVYVTPERKAAMIEAGVWEDPVLRQRMLRRYQKWDQENANQQ
jgi:hypothetical protein